MESKKVSRKWKILALILLSIFALLMITYMYGTYKFRKDYDNTNYCYYSICAEEPDAIYNIQTNVCTCYDYDVLGNEIVTKTEYLK